MSVLQQVMGFAWPSLVRQPLDLQQVLARGVAAAGADRGRLLGVLVAAAAGLQLFERERHIITLGGWAAARQAHLHEQQQASGREELQADEQQHTQLTLAVPASTRDYSRRQDETHGA
jgi:hypothetical protein